VRYLTLESERGMSTQSSPDSSLRISLSIAVSISLNILSCDILEFRLQPAPFQLPDFCWWLQLILILKFNCGLYIFSLSSVLTGALRKVPSCIQQMDFLSLDYHHLNVE